jgi:hypothetical protein
MRADTWRELDRPYVPPAAEMPEDYRRALRRVQRIAKLFDDRFYFPGTSHRFGLDGILGLIPGIGDAATGAVSLYLAAEAWRLGLPLSTILRMGVNVGIDTVVGAVPVLGDIFDFAWKANQKNARLVLEHLERDMAQARVVSPDARCPDQEIV